MPSSYYSLLLVKVLQGDKVINVMALVWVILTDMKEPRWQTWQLSILSLQYDKSYQ